MDRNCEGHVSNIFETLHLYVSILNLHDIRMIYLEIGQNLFDVYKANYFIKSTTFIDIGMNIIVKSNVFHQESFIRIIKSSNY